MGLGNVTDRALSLMFKEIRAAPELLMEATRRRAIGRSAKEVLGIVSATIQLGLRDGSFFSWTPAYPQQLLDFFAKEADLSHDYFLRHYDGIQTMVAIHGASSSMPTK